MRDCQIRPGERVTVDGPTGTIVAYNITLGDAQAFYEANPRELPENKIREEADRAYQELFIIADAPSDLTAGCDPAWMTTVLDGVGAILCHPEDWSLIRDDPLDGAVGTATISVGVLGADVESRNTTCASPGVAQVPGGSARVCALGPNPFGETIYGIALPNGRNIGIVAGPGASVADKALAFRIAANVESLQ